MVMNRLFEWFIYMVNEWFIWMVSFYMVIEWFIHIIYLDMFICMVTDGLMVYRIDWIWYVELTCHSIVNKWFISVVTKWFIASVDICRSSMDYHKWPGTRDTKVKFLFFLLFRYFFMVAEEHQTIQWLKPKQYTNWNPHHLFHNAQLK